MADDKEPEYIESEEVPKEEIGVPKALIGIKEKIEDNKLAKLDSFDNVGDALKLASILITAKALPSGFNSPEKVAVAIMYGRELGLGAVASMNNMHMVEGRTTLGIHALAALAEKAGLAWQVIVEYGKLPNSELNGSMIRFYKLWNGTVITNDITFSDKEAEAQGLLKKPTWLKMRKIMFRTRCLAIGCRFCAPAALLGVMTDTEIMDSKGIEYEVDDEGNVTSIKNTKNS